MKENMFIRQMRNTAAILLLVYLLLSIITGSIVRKEFTVTLVPPPNETVFTMEDLEYVSWDPAVLSCRILEYNPDSVTVQLKGLRAGKTSCSLRVKASGEVLSDDFYTVYFTGMVVDQASGDFSSCRVLALLLILALTAFNLLLWMGFFSSRRLLGYSYYSIFFIGAACWLSLTTVLLWILYFGHANMQTMYSSVQAIGRNFAILTCPLVLLFSLLLCISNLTLLRHEGCSFPNILGILLSVLMAAGILVIQMIGMHGFKGSEFFVEVQSALYETLCTVYSFAECFLLGAIVNGALSACHKPKQDLDYMIILGCKIKKDGTLFPLIRGRVDQVLTQYRNQLAHSGKKLYFVPSGGQGSDEMISEAEGMRRYLLSQGIPKEQILLEDQSGNTAENMRFSKALIQTHAAEHHITNPRIAFSTTNYHVFRSGIISRQQEFYPEGVGSPTKWYFWPNAFVREMVGMAAYTKRLLAVMLLVMVVFVISIQFIF
ncbi:MAG: YdcF family protein [Lachnospiraceae bacterium]|nr:YdcF family protein [Lachnospiraceae bacterium]